MFHAFGWLFDDNLLRKERVGSEFINSDPEQDTHHSDPEQDTHNSDPEQDTHNSDPEQDTNHSDPEKDTQNSDPEQDTHNSDPEQDTHNSDPEQDTHHSDPDESCPVRREQRQVQSRSCLDSIRSCPDSIYFHARSETALQYREKIF